MIDRGEVREISSSKTSCPMCPEPRYDEPFYWWGPGWQVATPREIADLLRDDTIDASSAALLWAALARRRSVAIVAGPSGLGKTTLLTALLTFLPAGTRRLYLRGCFETFAFLSNPTAAPERSVLLVNEISPHLPVYLWGAAVGQFLSAADRGYTLLATAHAESIPEFVGSLTASPLRLPAEQVAAFEFVVVLSRSTASASGRRVTGIWRLQRTRGGVGIEAADLACLHNISQRSYDTHIAVAPSWFPPAEFADRERVLVDLRDRRITALPDDRWLSNPRSPASSP